MPEARGLGPARSARRSLECNCLPKAGRRDSHGRTFREWSLVRVLRRVVTGVQPNRSWLYSVDELEDVNTHKVTLQIVRWQARFDDEHHPIWLNRSRYNVRSEEQWDSTSKVVDSYLDSSKLPSDPAFSEDFLQVSSGAKRRRGLGELEDNRDTEVVSLRLRLKEARSARAVEASAKRKAHSRIRAMKKHTGEYRRVLGEFKAVVNAPSATETDVHNFIEAKNPFWLFGLEYLGFDSKVGFPPKKPVFWFDLMLHRMDGFHDLVELKGPNERLFDRRTSRRAKLNTKLSEALGQVIAYLEACDRTRKAGLFKPKALIVIGTKKTDDPRQRRLLASHLANVEVLTYSQLVQRGDQLLGHLEGWKE
jgi:hypothetical protein